MPGIKKPFLLVKKKKKKKQKLKSVREAAQGEAASTPSLTQGGKAN